MQVVLLGWLIEVLGGLLALLLWLGRPFVWVTGALRRVADDVEIAYLLALMRRKVRGRK